MSHNVHFGVMAAETRRISAEAAAKFG